LSSSKVWTGDTRVKGFIFQRLSEPQPDLPANFRHAFPAASSPRGEPLRRRPTYHTGGDHVEQRLSCRMPDAGCRMPDAGCRMPDAGCRMNGI
jgi:hypothetical protein